MIHMYVKRSFAIRMISSLILGKYISKELWRDKCIEQSAKGIKKYGHTIDKCPVNKFDWKIMAIEELVDFWVYKFKMNQ